MTTWNTFVAHLSNLWETFLEAVGQLATQPFFWIILTLFVFGTLSSLQNIDNEKTSATIGKTLLNVWGEIVRMLAEVFGSAMGILKVALHFLSALEKLFFARLSDGVLQKLANYAILLLASVSFYATSSGMAQLWGPLWGIPISFGVQVGIVLSSFFVNREWRIKSDIKDAKTKHAYLAQKIAIIEGMVINNANAKRDYIDKLSIRKAEYEMQIGVDAKDVYVESESIRIVRTSCVKMFLHYATRIVLMSVSIVFAYISIYTVLINSRWYPDNLQIDIQQSALAVDAYHTELNKAYNHSINLMEHLYSDMRDTFPDLAFYISQNEAAEQAAIEMDNRIAEIQDEINTLNSDWRALGYTLAGASEEDEQADIIERRADIQAQINAFERNVDTLEEERDKEQLKVSERYEQRNLSAAHFRAMEQSLGDFFRQLSYIKRKTMTGKAPEGMDVAVWDAAYGMMIRVAEDNQLDASLPFEQYNFDSLDAAYYYLLRVYEEQTITEDLINTAQDYLLKGLQNIQASNLDGREESEGAEATIYALYEQGCREASRDLLGGIRGYLAGQMELKPLKGLTGDTLALVLDTKTYKSKQKTLSDREGLVVNDTHVFERALRKLFYVGGPSWLLALFAFLIALVPDVGIILIMRLRITSQSPEILERRKRLLIKLMFAKVYDTAVNQSIKHVQLAACLGVVGGVSVYLIQLMQARITGAVVSSGLLLLYMTAGAILALLVIRAWRSIHPPEPHPPEPHPPTEAFPVQQTELMSQHLQPWAREMLSYLETGPIIQYKGFDYMSVLMPDTMEQTLLLDSGDISRFSKSNPPCLPYSIAKSKGWVPLLMALQAKDFLYLESNRNNMTEASKASEEKGFFVFSNLFMVTISDILATFVCEQNQDISSEDRELDSSTMDELMEDERRRG